MAARPMSGLVGALLDLLFPARCAGCRRRGTMLCDPCRAGIERLGVEVCPLCARPNRLGRICPTCNAGESVLDGVRAACLYGGTTRTAVHDLKYRRVRGQSAVLADLLAEAVDRRPLAIDLMIPVPLATGRRRARGFNQSELIARHLGRNIGVPVNTAVLRRTRETPQQVGLLAEARRENVFGAFTCVSPEAVRGRRVALVDDVMTTGATLDACAGVLKESGAVRVYALVVARAAQ